jgi:glycosyltransferase involved in cell wall biosynthesis
MRISLILCTYNRCQFLVETLESIAASVLPESVEWEVFVVDNNSSDQTRELVEGFCHRYPERFHYVFERQQGLSCARNAGIREGQGEVIAFTDDDVIVEPDWLWNLTSVLQAGEWAGAGGRIIAVWPGPIPGWLSTADSNALGPYGEFNLGPKAGPLSRPPYGANMAFRREVFERYGDFRTDLGRTGSSLQGREDVEFANRLLTASEPLWYEPDAVVRHRVQQRSMEKRYVLSWWYWYGRSEVAELGPPPGKWIIKGIPLGLFRRLARWTLQWLISIGAQRRLVCQRTAWYLAGTAVACYQQSWLSNPQQAAATSVQMTHPEQK